MFYRNIFVFCCPFEWERHLFCSATSLLITEFTRHTYECIWNYVVIVIGFCVSPFSSLSHNGGGGWMSGNEKRSRSRSESWCWSWNGSWSGTGSDFHALFSDSGAAQRLRWSTWPVYLQP